MTQFYTEVRDRFIKYVKINTESIANSNETPSTMGQFDLARVLYDELIEMGASEAYLDEKCCVVYGTIPKTEEGRTFGLIAHVDTAPDAPGKDVKPWVLKNYDGKDVVLNKEKNIVLETSVFPNILKYIGEDIVFTDGTTLLGGDDKASIASIMTMANYLLHHKEIKHPEIRIAFTPDEEVGGLAKDLDFNRFGAKIAYTLDGDYLGYYSYETFNAIEAQLTIKGVSVHTATAKGKMKNAVQIGVEFINSLPASERPEKTEGREGFFHPHVFNGTVENAFVRCLIRDFDSDSFENRKQVIKDIVEKLNNKYGEGTVSLEFKMGYRSMKDAVEKEPYMVPNLVEAIKKAGITPVELAFRGGTDGSSLSNRGLPTPNLSAGYENAHSRFEFVPIINMEKNVEILINLAEIYAK